MANSEKKIVVSEWLLFLFLCLFPLGQLIRIKWLHPIDVIAGFSIIFLIFQTKVENRIYKYLKNFLSACIFSLIFSLTFLPLATVLIGFLYFLRIFAYASWFLMVRHLVEKKPKYRKVIFNSLILVALSIAVFGWLQYVFMPDLRFLKAIGWDDHLFRLAGSFLDPGFTAIMLVFGFLTTLALYLKKGGVKHFTLLAFLLLSIALTYSRASYLGLIVGFSLLAFLFKKKNILIMIVVFLVLILKLPRPGGEGVKLERTYSIFAKLANYKQTFQIVKEYPLFGVGFNNICQVRRQMFGNIGHESHSCSGSDSSLLLIIATTGIVGLMIFLSLAHKTLKAIKQTVYGKAFLACFVALAVNSFFINSLFYPWVLGWMGMLLAISSYSRE